MKKNTRTVTICAQMVIKNEDQFVWYAINSVLPYVHEFLICDTGSSDKTLPILSLIKFKKIKLEKKQINSREDIVSVRKNQLEKTNADWILLVDWDEVWGEKQIEKLIKVIKNAKAETWAVVNRTRNVVGDIYHYQDTKAGKYTLLGKTDHLTIRAMRRKNLEIGGVYPNEAYTINGRKIQDSEKNLMFCETWYLHATHLQRSSSGEASKNTIDRVKKRKMELGIEMRSEETPEIFGSKEIPLIVPRPQEHKVLGWRKMLAWLVTAGKNVKRSLQS